MYRTPGSNLDTFTENVEHIFSDAKVMKTILVCGDLNIDLLKHESHNSTRNFIDMMYSLGLHPLIYKPTRITDTSATLIDKCSQMNCTINLLLAFYSMISVIICQCLHFVSLM